MREEPCKKFVMVNYNQGLDISPLHDKYMTPPKAEPPDKRQQLCQINTVPLIDEYAVNFAEDELDKDNHSLDDPDEDDETSDALIIDFSPSNNQAVEDEIQHVSKSQAYLKEGSNMTSF
ncbi:hypothetical protein EJD97_025729, partial [Solanum chilense]